MITSPFLLYCCWILLNTPETTLQCPPNMPFFSYDHHPLRCPGHKPKSGKVLPIAGLLFLPPKDRSSRTSLVVPWLTPGFHCRGHRFPSLLGELRSCKFWSAAKRQVNLFFFLHSHHQAIFNLSLFKSLQEFLVTVRVNFICQLRKLQLLIIQSNKH